jgi:hypothetical protein
MKIITYCAFALLAAGIAACSTAATDPTPDPTPVVKPEPISVKKPYDNTKGGVQITRVYYNQAQNRDSALLGLTAQDECILLESVDHTSIEGWKLDASDSQLFTLQGSIHGKLYIFTKDGPTASAEPVIALHYGSWIWNNAEPDTAKIFNERGELVDAMTYRGN